MQSFVDKARTYMKALMKAGDFNIEDVATMTESSVSTVKNFLYGKTTKNPGFDSIVNWILALGGDLNELVGYEKKKETEVNSIVSLKESYELIIADVQKQCEIRIADIKALSDLRVADVRADADKRVEDLVRFYEARIKEMKQAGT